jgi:hypothetical protein
VSPLLPAASPEPNGMSFESSKSRKISVCFYDVSIIEISGNFCVLLWRFEPAQFAEFLARIWEKLVQRQCHHANQSQLARRPMRTTLSSPAASSTWRTRSRLTNRRGNGSGV